MFHISIFQILGNTKVEFFIKFCGNSMKLGFATTAIFRILHRKYSGGYERKKIRPTGCSGGLLPIDWSG